MTESKPEPALAQVSARVVHVGVEMGDHAQDVTRVVEVGPGETFHDAARRLLGDSRYLSHEKGANYMIVQLVEQLVEPCSFDAIEVPF